MGRDELRAIRPGIVLAALASVLVGCDNYGGLTRETMAACISEAGIAGSYAASSTLRNDRMTFIVRPGPNVTADQSAIANACIERTIASPRPLPRQDVPSVAGVQQRVTSVQTATGRTDTYTYGTPPSAAPVGSGRRSCGLQMVGGTGYRCAR